MDSCELLCTHSSGLKIRFSERGVGVRVPPAYPSIAVEFRLCLLTPRNADIHVTSKCSLYDYLYPSALRFAQREYSARLIAAVAWRIISGRTWLYVSRVVLIAAWPRSLATILGWTPCVGVG